MAFGELDVVEWVNWIKDALRAHDNLTTDLRGADVVLVVAGQSFVGGPSPLSCLQIKQAFQQGKPVVPIFVNDAQMPEDLPADIREFTHQQAVTITSNWEIPGAVARVIAAHRNPAVSHRAASRSTRQSSTSVSTQSLDPIEPSVFICYRRDDSGYWADALACALGSKVGAGGIFFDVGSQQPGRDYCKQIDEALARSTHFVVVIGPGFLEPDAQGARRIDDKRDQVRREIRSALATKLPIHVVLTGDTNLPARLELPADIAGLANARSISRLKTEADADIVAEEIVAKRHRATPGKGKTDVLDEWRLEQQTLQKVADSVMAKLVDYGWDDVSQRYDRGKYYTLGHSQYPRFRFEIQVENAEIALQENIQSVWRLGFRRWITRTVFSISPLTYITADLLQLPANLLDAALDPSQYLDRIGRCDWMKSKQRKVMREHNFLANVKHEAQPNPPAVEAYQQMRRYVSAHGGLSHLVSLGRILDWPADSLARGSAFHPDGSWLAVVSDGGLHMVSTYDWQVNPSVLAHGPWLSVNFSRQGHLAIGSDKGSVLTWETDGSPIEAVATPYSLLRRVRAPWAGEEIAFTTVSWSDSGDVLACCGGDAVWIYHVATSQFTRWKVPECLALNMYYGAHFIRGRSELLVYGRFHYIWVVRLPSMQVRCMLDLERRPNRLNFNQYSNRAAETSTGPAFKYIYTAKPSPCGNLFACGGSYGQVAVYDLNSMDPVTTLAWHEPIMQGIQSPVQAVSFSPNGQWLASLGGDGKLVIGSTHDWVPERVARAVDFPINASIAWSPDSTTMAVTTTGHVQLWRM